MISITARVLSPHPPAPYEKSAESEQLRPNVVMGIGYHHAVSRHLRSHSASYWMAYPLMIGLRNKLDERPLNKKLSCRREAARCFVFVSSQLQHTYSAVFKRLTLR